MALAIDGSSPAVATQTNGATATVVSASFTPPANSLLLVMWTGDALSTPSAPTITDNLGTPLTYTRTDWMSVADSPNPGGQCAAWTAPVATSAAMAVTVTSGSVSGERVAALCIRVMTDTNGQPSSGAHGKSGSKSAGSIAQSYSALATGGWGFLADCDFDETGPATAGTGCTLIGSANINTNITYGFDRRTTADDTSGSNTTLNLTLGGTSTNLSWIYVEIQPATSTAAVNAAGPWTGPTPGRIGPTGQWNVALGDATTPLNVYAPAEAAATGVAFDAAVDVDPVADQTAGTGAAFDATPDTQVDADQTSGAGTAYDATVNVDYGNAAGPWTLPTPGYLGPTGRLSALIGDATTPLNVYAPDVATGTGQAFDVTIDTGAAADQTAGAGTAFDATPDVQVQADQTTAAGQAFDAIITTDYGNYAGPWTGPVPGRGSPTGQWTAPPTDPTPTGALAVPADQTSATGTAFDATIDVGLAADIAAGTGAALDAVLAVAAAVDNAFATGTALDAAANFAVAGDVAAGSGAGFGPLAGMDYPAAGPWTRPTPGRISPTGQWTAPTGVIEAVVPVCTTGRPSTGATGRPGSGTTARPNTGITADPC